MSTSLCEYVKKHLTVLADAFQSSALAIIDDSDGVCRVSSSELSIALYLDPRNDFVSSSLLFLNVCPEVKDELYTHILAKIAEETRIVQSGSSDLDTRIAQECDNVARILHYIRRHNIGGTELYYFHLGYNEGYSDTVSL